jgi:hypothetical protein
MPGHHKVYIPHPLGAPKDDGCDCYEAAQDTTFASSVDDLGLFADLTPDLQVVQTVVKALLITRFHHKFIPTAFCLSSWLIVSRPVPKQNSLTLGKRTIFHPM